MSVGCHRLLQREEDPARLVTSVAEVLSYCGSADLVEGPSGAMLPGGPEPVRRPYDGLDAVARSVLDGFPGRGRSVTEAELSRLSGQPISEVIAALPVLQGAGLITVAREGYRLASVAS
jgi:DNA processing protein